MCSRESPLPGINHGRNARVLIIVCVWVAISGLAYWGMPPIQRSFAKMALVMLAVLGGPITGIVSAASSGKLADSIPVVASTVVVSVLALGLHWRFASLWSLSLAVIVWMLAGFILSVGVGV